MKEKDQILFQKYLDGQLDQNQRIAFESRLGDDAGFKAEFDLYKMMNAHLDERSKNKSALDVLKTVHQEQVTPSEKKVGKSFKLWISIAAAASLLLFSVFLVNKYTGGQVLYADLYSAPVLPGEKGDNGNPVEAQLATALVDFDTDPSLAAQKLIALEIDPYLKARWVVETFAYHEMADSVLYYLPPRPTDQILRDRLNYLEILAYFKKGDQVKVKALIEALPEDTDAWYKSIYVRLLSYF